jgi:hypothetical protein
MATTSSLSACELRYLRPIAERFVCASYWEDKTIKNYRALGLVSCDGKRIELTDAGKIACSTLPVRDGGSVVRAGVSLYHPI